VKREGKTVVGYGAPGKGNTLLNLLRHPHRLHRLHRGSEHLQARQVPAGTHIPIFHPDRIAEVKPDYVLILPWNLRDEIVRQMAFIRQWEGSSSFPFRGSGPWMKPTTITFFGNFGTRNLGNEWTLQAMIENARAYVPTARMKCVCTNPQETSGTHGITAFPMSYRFGEARHS